MEWHDVSREYNEWYDGWEGMRVEEEIIRYLLMPVARAPEHPHESSRMAMIVVKACFICICIEASSLQQFSARA